MGLFSNLFGNKNSATKISGKCKVEFDENGKVQNIEAQQGNWSSERKGSYWYYTQKAGTLLQATEILRKLNSIPQFNYYVVVTPDGSIGRDIQGFYTEAPVKTKNFGLEIGNRSQVSVEASSLTGFGNMFANQQSVAQLKSQNSYAKLILMMKCGHCGYESPVETEPGTFTRECYCCGAKNKCQRGNVSVYLGSRMVEI